MKTSNKILCSIAVCFGLLATSAFAGSVWDQVQGIDSNDQAYAEIPNVPAGAEIVWWLYSDDSGSNAGIELGGSSLNIIRSVSNGFISDDFFTSSAGTVTYYMYAQAFNGYAAGDIEMNW